MRRLLAVWLSAMITWNGATTGLAAAPEDRDPIYEGQSLKEWIAALRDPDEEVRQQAAYAMWKIGPKAKPALATIKEAVKDSAQQVSHYALYALGSMGPETVPFLIESLDSESSSPGAQYALNQMGPIAVPALLRAIASDNVQRRRGAAAALGRMGSTTKQVVPALRKSLKDSDGLVRLNAAESLQIINRGSREALLAVVETLRHKDPEVRWQGARVLQNFGGLAEEAVPALEAALHDPSHRVRIWAAWVLGNIDPEQAPKLVPVLVDAVKDKDEPVCREAVNFLQQFVHRDQELAGPAIPVALEVVKNWRQHESNTVWSGIWILVRTGQVKTALPVVLEALKHPDPAISEPAARNLPALALEDPAVLPALFRALEHPNEKVRVAAAGSLARFTSKADVVVQPLIQALKHAKTPRLRSSLAYTLGSLGTAAKPAIPELMDLLDHKHLLVRVNAGNAMVRIDPKQAGAVLPVLIRSLNYRQTGYHYSTMDHLRQLGPEAATGMTRALRSKDQELRRGAAYGLADMRTPGQFAVQSLKEALKHEDADTRALAAAALARISPQTEGILPALLEGLDSPDVQVREHSVHSLGSLGPRAKPAVPALVRIIQDKEDDYQLRYAAIHDLGGIGVGAQAAVPTLAAILKDKGSNLRGAAAEGLSRIGSKDETLIPALLDMLMEPGGMSAHYATEALSKFGDRALPYLLKLLKDQDPHVRSQAARLLAVVGRHDSDDVIGTWKGMLNDPAITVRLMVAGELQAREQDPKKALDLILPHVKAATKDADGLVRMQGLGVLRNFVMRHWHQQSSEDVISLIRDAMRDKDSRVRAQAVQVVFSTVPLPKELTSPLLERLKDSDEGVRRGASIAVFALRPVAKDATPALLEALKTKDEVILNNVIHVLGSIGKNDERVLPALLRTLKANKSPPIRDSVILALGAYGEQAKSALPAVVAMLQDANPSSREVAIRTLAKLDPESKLLPAALADLLGKQGPKDERFHFGRGSWMSQVLEQLPTDTVIAFTKMLSDKDPNRRMGAALALGAAGRAVTGSTAALRDALKDESPPVRLYAAIALWQPTGKTDEAMPVLIEFLGGKEMAYRRQAARVLGEIGPGAKAAVPALVEALKAADRDLPYLAVNALSRIGLDAKAAIPALVDLLKESGDPGMRYSLAIALGKFGPDAKAAVPELKQMLKDPNAREREIAVGALVKIAPAKEIAPVLIDALREDPEGFSGLTFRHYVADALHQAGPTICPDVARLLKDKQPEVRGAAADILAGFGKDAKDTVAALLERLKDEDEEVAVKAAVAVWEIAKGKEAVPALIKGLKAKSATLRQRSAQALQRIGADAKEAVPALLKAANDRNEMVRQSARFALQAIDPQAAAQLTPP